MQYIIIKRKYQILIIKSINYINYRVNLYNIIYKISLNFMKFYHFQYIVPLFNYFMLTI